MLKRRYFLILLLFSALHLGADAPSPTLAQRIANHQQATAGPARSISNWNMPLGKAVLRLAKGHVLPLLEGDREIGFYFRGEGELCVPIDQSDELPAVRFNLDRNTSVKLREGIASLFIDLPLKELTLLYEGVPLPAFGPEAPQEQEALQKGRSGYQERFLAPGWRNRTHMMLAARYNQPPQPAWYLSLVGDKGLWEFARDPWTERTEELWFARTRSAREGKHLIKDLVGLQISVRKLGTASRRAITPPLVLRHLDLEFEGRKSGACRYVATETLMPQMTGIRMVSLNLMNEVYDWAKGEMVPLKMKKVTLNGLPLAFDHRENELLVELLNPTEAGLPLQLRFEVEGNFLTHPGGDNRWELGNEPWFPSLVMEGMRFTATARIRSEKPFFPMASGRVLGRREEGDFHILETKLEQPTWSFFVLAGNYFLEEKSRNGLTVRVASYGQKANTDGKLANLALDMIQFYEGILGPFPVKELNVVQRNEWGSGQGPNGFLFITNEAFNPLIGAQNQWFSRGVNQRFAHEIAHQYWGNQVLIASQEDGWISEAFAQYCSALLIRAGKGEGEFNRLIAEWTGYVKDQAERGTIPMLGRLDDLDDPAYARKIRWTFLYGKGALLLHRIHKEIGDQAFATLMRSFQKSLQGRPGTTQDLINLLKLITQKDYTNFFESCFWGFSLPN